MHPRWMNLEASPRFHQAFTLAMWICHDHCTACGILSYGMLENISFMFISAIL